MLPLPPDPRDSTDLRELFMTKYYTKPSQATLEKLYQVQGDQLNMALWYLYKVTCQVHTCACSTVAYTKQVTFYWSPFRGADNICKECF